MAPGNRCEGKEGRRESCPAGWRGVYAMFNNISMLEDALRFQALLPVE